VNWKSEQKLEEDKRHILSLQIQLKSNKNGKGDL